MICDISIIISFPSTYLKKPFIIEYFQYLQFRFYIGNKFIICNHYHLKIVLSNKDFQIKGIYYD